MKSFKSPLKVLAIALMSQLVINNSAFADSYHPEADQVELLWKVIDHEIGENIFLGSLTITNNGIEPLGDKDWSLFFSSVRPPASVLPIDSIDGNNARKQMADQFLSLKNADKSKSGDYFVLEPVVGFEPIQPGESREIMITAQYWQMLKNDSPSGFHISFNGNAPHAVSVDVVMDPSDPKQTKQSVDDNMPVQTASLRFSENTATELNVPIQNYVVPQLQSAELSDAGFLTLLGSTSSINAPDDLSKEAVYLQSALKDLIVGEFPINKIKPNVAGLITLKLNPLLDTDSDGVADNEGYKLSIDPFNGIVIEGKDASGVFYGIQSLRQLIPNDVYQASVGDNKMQYAVLPAVTSLDAPRFEYRGMMLDVARHFQTKETIFKLIDLLAYYKINKFEMNVANDEGWRLEIPGIPELTEFSAKRGYDINDASMLHIAMGSGNEFSSGDGIEGKPENITEANNGVNPNFQGFEIAQQNFLGKGWGYYTVEDFKDILKYAADRHIDIILEYDFPAHARAAVKAMEYRYNKYKDTDLAEANRYRLIDPLDESQYYTAQFYTDNIVNPSLEGTYAFLNKVISETKAMYDAVPEADITRLHGGGDELPPLGANEWWAKSPAIQKNPETAGKTDAELFDYFFSRWISIINQNGFKMASWGDVLTHNGTGNVDYGELYPIFWNNVWGWGNEHQSYVYANKGYQVVLSHATNLYFDLAYNKHPDEIGYHWAGYTDTKKAFEYRPFNIYANGKIDKLGNPVEWNPNWVELTEEGKQNIVGLQGQLFSENAKSPEIMEYLVFPKLLGVAERAWVTSMPAELPIDQSGKTPMDQAWDTFANTLGQHALAKLEFIQPVDIYNQLPPQHGVNYRVPLPGAVIEGGMLNINTRFPGLENQYSLDGGQSWVPYYAPINVNHVKTVKTRSVTMSGRSSRVEAVSQQ
ncbi:family 20 glycosylhydrolase [Photobacterium nomapromontoriensis]|uniref:family 20 glycosylhydrolase n=1 Tax=Photobacterium nomapromontoriensis TaxID=2910237 RepID=UPI003D13540C